MNKEELKRVILSEDDFLEDYKGKVSASDISEAIHGSEEEMLVAFCTFQGWLVGRYGLEVAKEILDKV